MNPLDERPSAIVIGWREWVALPDLGVASIKAKVDTGARTSSLHALDVETFSRRGKDWVRFKVYPQQRKSVVELTVEAEVLEYRTVTSSGGHATKRPVILTTVEVVGERRSIELTLASRATMGFRMLLGREAVRGRFLVDPGKSYYGGKPSKPKPKKAKRKRG